MENYDREEYTNILKVEGVKAKGYGIIPKLIMQDRSIPIRVNQFMLIFVHLLVLETMRFQV